MNRYYNAIISDKGVPIPGGKARVLNSSGGVVSLFSDASGTPISGNIATADADGNVLFYWTAAAGQSLQILNTDETLLYTVADFAANQDRANLFGSQAQSTITNLTTDLAARPTSATLAATTGAAQIGKSGGGTLADTASAFSAADRTAVSALNPTVSKAAIVAAQGDRSLYKLDTRVPAGETGATNERTQGYNNPGRRRRFIAPGTGTGRFVSEDGVTHVSHYGISPWNTAGQNDAAWNVLRDEITDLQTRQENRPLVLQFDNYRYDMSSRWEVRNNYLTIDGRGAELVGGGIFFTNNGSVNQQLYCAIKDMVIRGAAGQSIPVLQSRVSSYLTVDNVTLWGTAGQHGAYLGGGNTSTFKQLRVYGAGLYGIFMTAENAPHPSGGVAGRGQPIDLTFIDMDVQGCGGGVGIYEAQSIRFYGGAIQSGTGVYNRGLSIETGYDVSVFGTHFERNGADIYIQPVDRLGTSLWGAPLPHGSITLAGLGIGGEGIGGAPSPTSLLVAGDTPDLVVTGGYYSGAVNINTTGTTGAAIGAKMPIYSAVAGSPFVRMGARGAAVADAAAATYVAPSGGTTIDAEARTAIAQIAADVASLRTSNNAHLARQRVFGSIAT